MLRLLFGLAAVLWVTAAPDGHAQQLVLERLGLDATTPTARASGEPGRISLISNACRTDIPDSELRRRIVDIAVQEWGFFGLPIVDETAPDPDPGPGGDAGRPTDEPNRGSAYEPPVLIDAGIAGVPDRLRRPAAGELMRTALSVAGYWSVTEDGPWIVDRQNAAWREPEAQARWRYRWSAAFVSWVACEAGLAENSRFQRHVAHYAYIDQAIRARDGAAPKAAYVAYDIGEAAIAPGDLLCSGRDPSYRALAERRRQIGTGVTGHCDIVVALDAARQFIFTVGGNVRGMVAMKVFPAVVNESGLLRPVNATPDSEDRMLFAHLRLRADPIEADALWNSPTLQTLMCMDAERIPAPPLAAGLITVAGKLAGCAAGELGPALD